MVPPAIGYNRFQCPAIPPGNPNGRRKNTGLNSLLFGSTFRRRAAQNALLSYLVFLMQIAWFPDIFLKRPQSLCKTYNIGRVGSQLDKATQYRCRPIIGLTHRRGCAGYKAKITRRLHFGLSYTFLDLIDNVSFYSSL